MWQAALRFSCVALVLGCTYTSETIGDSSQLDAVFTVRQPDREFDALRTFAMPETVADLSDLVEDPQQLSDAHDQGYIDRVAENLADYGWMRVGDTATADVVVLNGKVAADNWVTYSYWYPYYPYYIYYPYYPYDTVSVNLPVGTLFTVMLEQSQLENVDSIETVPAIWTATALGLLSSNASPGARIDKVVDQAFAQSDYLVVGDSVDAVYGLDVMLP